MPAGLYHCFFHCSLVTGIVSSLLACHSSFVHFSLIPTLHSNTYFIIAISLVENEQKTAVID